MYDELQMLNAHWRRDVARPEHEALLGTLEECGVQFLWVYGPRQVLRLGAFTPDAEELCAVDAWVGASHGMMLTLLLADLAARSTRLEA